MKIFIPAHSFPDSFVDNVAVTLREMGHEVRTLGEQSLSSNTSMLRYRLRRLKESVTRPAGKLLKAARDYKPDVVLALTSTFDAETLTELRAFTKPVLWWGDPPHEIDGWGALDEGWHVVFHKDKATVEKLKLAGRNAHLLHEACNPAWHKPIARRASDSLVVAGNSYAFRQALLERLASDSVPVELYGPEPPRWAAPAVKKMHAGRYVVREDKSRVFGEGLACLNSFSLAEGDSLNCRAFEIAGASGLQLIEYRPAIEDCFGPGKELLTFKTYDELLELLARAHREPRWAESVREAGTRRAHAHHTYRQRLETILAAL